MEFKHFSHKHPLTLNEKIQNIETPAKCNVCKKVCVGPTYSCDQCSDFFLDKSCTELPDKFQSPYRRHHLYLFDSSSPDRRQIFNCHACREDIGGFAYHSELWDLILDAQCALLEFTIDEGQDHLLHNSHFHPLVFKDKHVAVDCSACGEFISGALYSCDPCRFYLHQSCSRLPGSLSSSSHRCPHGCPLVLQTRPRNDYGKGFCNACDHWTIPHAGSYYYCQPCSFSIDIRCARLNFKMESEGLQLFHHFGHGRPLRLGEIKPKDSYGIYCALCNEICSGQTYICCVSECKYFLHPYCFELPQIISHPFHRSHPLTLTKPGKTIHCIVCLEYFSGFSYCCGTCDFKMHVNCPANTYIIKYQGHHHDLFFAPNSWKSYYANCHACGAITNTSSQKNSPLFRCLECDFFLHLTCGPLPCTIKYENHLCRLTLTDSPVVAEHEDIAGTTQFVCHECEKVDRDPRLPVYYCEGCLYIAEFDCVISEVIRSLMGVHGEVELKTPIRHVTGKVIKTGMEVIELQEAGQGSEVEINPTLTFHENFRPLIEVEKDEFVSIITAARSDCDRDSSELSPLIADKDYFSKKLDRTYEECLAFIVDRIARQEKYVTNRLVPFNLSRTLEGLCAKYGDISAESTLKCSKTKTYFTNMLCATINNMYARRVVDIHEGDLANWWANLKILQVAGFKVQFAFDLLQDVMHAYKGLQIEEAIKKNREKLNNKITEISQTIEHLKEELAKQTAKLEETMEISNKLESEPVSSGFGAKCLKEASERRWKVAADGLLTTTETAQ